MAAPQLIRLAAGSLRVELAPAIGGSISRFEGGWREDERQGRVDWLRPASPAALSENNPLGMSSFPLLPFCNRIRNGRASFEGREIRFPPNHPAERSPHPLHGIGWQRPWAVQESGATHAVLTLDVPASTAWPWRFCASQHFELDDEMLRVTMALTNLDRAGMPAGIGHHPYFPHTRGTRLTSSAAAMWETDAEVMPTTLAVTDTVEKLRAGVVLSELALDNNFVGWEHSALVQWPADRTGPARSLLMEAATPLDYFVLYSPRGFDHFCAEPVSQCTDCLNLLAQCGPGAVGGARVPPGQSLRASFTLSPHWS